MSELKELNDVAYVRFAAVYRKFTDVGTFMNELKALGVRLALDDFGTGYSSLSYLRELPLDVIKIDKCFVNEVGEDAFSDAFVKTVAELADTIHVNVIVEGVEDQSQESALEDMKVHMIQGYLYDQPLTQDEFESKYLD